MCVATLNTDLYQLCRIGTFPAVTPNVMSFKELWPHDSSIPTKHLTVTEKSEYFPIPHTKRKYYLLKRSPHLCFDQIF